MISGTVKKWGAEAFAIRESVLLHSDLSCKFVVYLWENSVGKLRNPWRASSLSREADQLTHTCPKAREAVAPISAAAETLITISEQAIATGSGNMMETSQVLQQQQERHAQPAVDVLLMLLYNEALYDDDMHILLQGPPPCSLSH
jgi:hypothetical protein